MLHQIAMCVLCKNQEITRFPQFFVIMMAHKFSRLKGGFILHKKSQMHIIFVTKTFPETNKSYESRRASLNPTIGVLVSPITVQLPNNVFFVAVGAVDVSQ